MPIIGREPPADIVIPAPQVSARHAELRPLGPGLFQLTDLGSTNGTFVNGQRIRSAQVRVSDAVCLGSLQVDLRRYVQGAPSSPGPELARGEPRRPTSSFSLRIAGVATGLVLVGAAGALLLSRQTGKPQTPVPVPAATSSPSPAPSPIVAAPQPSEPRATPPSPAVETGEEFDAFFARFQTDASFQLSRIAFPVSYADRNCGSCGARDDEPIERSSWTFHPFTGWVVSNRGRDEVEIDGRCQPPDLTGPPTSSDQPDCADGHGARFSLRSGQWFLVAYSTYGTLD